MCPRALQSPNVNNGWYQAFITSSKHSAWSSYFSGHKPQHLFLWLITFRDAFSLFNHKHLLTGREVSCTSIEDTPLHHQYTKWYYYLSFLRSRKHFYISYFSKTRHQIGPVVAPSSSILTKWWLGDLVRTEELIGAAADASSTLEDPSMNMLEQGSTWSWQKGSLTTS